MFIFDSISNQTEIISQYNTDEIELSNIHIYSPFFQNFIWYKFNDDNK